MVQQNSQLKRANQNNYNQCLSKHQQYQSSQKLDPNWDVLHSKTLNNQPSSARMETAQERKDTARFHNQAQEGLKQDRIPQRSLVKQFITLATCSSKTEGNSFIFSFRNKILFQDDSLWRNHFECCLENGLSNQIFEKYIDKFLSQKN